MDAQMLRIRYYCCTVLLYGVCFTTINTIVSSDFNGFWQCVELEAYGLSCLHRIVIHLIARSGLVVLKPAKDLLRTTVPTRVS